GGGRSGPALLASRPRGTPAGRRRTRPRTGAVHRPGGQRAAPLRPFRGAVRRPVGSTRSAGSSRSAGSAEPARPYQAGLVGQDDQLGAVAGAQFHHGPADVGLGGERTDDETP